MSRRVARRRLYRLNEQGEVLTETAGAGISDSIGVSSRLRAGSEIVSEITLDLANGTAPANSFDAGAGAPGSAEGVSVIGVSSSTGTHAAAYAIQVDTNTVAGTTNGVITSGELICVETPTVGGTTIGLWYGTNASGSGEDMGAGGTELLRAAPQVIGKDGTFDVDTTIDNAYIYLVHSGSTAGTYGAGKLVLRLYGFNIFDDVA